MRGCCLFILFFLPQLITAQLSYNLQFAETERKCDSLAKIYGSLPSKENEEFKYSITAFQQSLFTYNEIDRNQKYEKYLLDVFKKINPKSTYIPQVYIFKSSYPNAFTVFNGDIFFHWAFIADLEDEAGLAYTMGHEVTHYDASHLYLSYLGNSKKVAEDKNQVIKNYQFEQKQEYFSDSVGFLLGAKAGYKWESGLSDFYEFVSLDTIMNYMHKKTNVYNSEGKLINDVYYNDQSDTLFTTHPPTNSRIKKWKAWGEKENSIGKKFIVNEIIFKEFQQYCREQTLQHYLKEQQLRLGIIKAFKYYVLNPSNNKIKYYLLEFTRRYVSTYPSAADKPFLSDIFNLEKEKNIEDNLRWIFRNESDLAIAKKFIPSFFNNENSSYSDIITKLCSSIETENPEFYLSLALLNANNDSLKQKYINQYLFFDDIQFRDFAMAYKENELAYKFRDFNKRLVIYGGTEFLVRNSNGVNSQTLKQKRFAEKVNEQLYPFINKQKLKNTEVLSEYSLLQQGKYDDFANIVKPWMKRESNSHADNASGLKIYNSNSRLTSSPELWTYLYQQKIVEIKYIKAYSLKDDRISIAKNFVSYFNSIAKTRYGSKKDYFGQTRNLYLIDLYTMGSQDFMVNDKELAVKAPLNADLLMTEIYLLLK